MFIIQNYILNDLLKVLNARIEVEQKYMKLSKIVKHQYKNQIISYSEAYKNGYLSIHNNDLYWVGNRVIENLNKFHVFLAIVNNEVVGYIDVTYNNEENEPFDLFVKKEYRHQGIGKDLLQKAIETNYPKQMMLYVDMDNNNAINLYHSEGFVDDESMNNITAHLILKEE